MKIKTTGKILLLSAGCVLSLLMSGCGASGAQPDGGAVKKAADEGTSQPGESNLQEETGQAQEENQVKKEEAVQEENTQESSGSSSGRWHVLDPEVAEAVDADFEGMVWKIDADSFYIAEAMVELMEDGTILGGCPSPDAEIPDSDLIQVVFDEDTYFYIRTIHGDGETYEDTEAGFQDLEAYVSVEMRGEFENDVFHADKIRIIKVS